METATFLLRACQGADFGTLDLLGGKYRGAGIDEAIEDSLIFFG